VAERSRVDFNDFQLVALDTTLSAIQRLAKLLNSNVLNLANGSN
jgi:hypothetical protein